MKCRQCYLLPIIILCIGCIGHIGKLPAQEMEIYKGLLKESIDTHIITELKPQDNNLNPFLNPIALDANKQALPRLGYNYELNALISNTPETVIDRKYTISPYATSMYTNSEEYDAIFAALESDNVSNSILTPLVAIAKLDIFALARFLMGIGVLPNQPFETKEMKRDKKLKEIKSIYDID